MTVSLSRDQSAAIRKIADWYKGGTRTPQVFYLAGYAGVGKSTLYNVVREELRRHGAKKTITCAYTGKAVNVLRRKGNNDAMTLHSALYKALENPESGKVEFKLDPAGHAADADLIGVDECSMVGPVEGTDLLSFGKKVLVMGDPGQLPPIKGQGFFTTRKPDVFLREVHRQAAESPILRLATMARQGIELPIGEWDGTRVLMLNRKTEDLIHRPDTQVIAPPLHRR